VLVRDTGRVGRIAQAESPNFRVEFVSGSPVWSWLSASSLKPAASPAVVGAPDVERALGLLKKSLLTSGPGIVHLNRSEYEEALRALEGRSQ
jgi:hypothetical protein